MLKISVDRAGVKTDLSYAFFYVHTGAIQDCRTSIKIYLTWLCMSTTLHFSDVLKKKEKNGGRQQQQQLWVCSLDMRDSSAWLQPAWTIQCWAQWLCNPPWLTGKETLATGTTTQFSWGQEVKTPQLGPGKGREKDTHRTWITFLMSIIWTGD